MIILGIDPGFLKTGWAILSTNDKNNVRYEDSGVVLAPISGCLSLRLGFIFKAIDDVIIKYRPDICSIEKTYVNINSQSSLKLAQARGVIISAIGVHMIEMFEYEAKTIKKTVVGNGNADKMQVAKILSLLLPGFSPNAKHLDESDAVAIAYCGSYAKVLHKSNT